MCGRKAGSSSGKQSDPGAFMTRLQLLLAATALSACTAAAQNAGNAENGKKLYMKNGCYECHGTVGQGAGANPVAPNLAPKPKPLAFLTAYIRKPAGNMPPYTSKVMSNAEIADVWAYLATIPEQPPVKNIPLLNSR
jgi:ubiquinol-cytochrome c reductase cytochrome c subunit